MLCKAFYTRAFIINPRQSANFAKALENRSTCVRTPYKGVG